MPQPSFDTWTIIFLFFAFQGLLTGIAFLFIKRSQQQPFRFIGVLLILFGLCLIDYELFWTHYSFQVPALAEFSFPFYFLFGPLLYWYFRFCLRKTSFVRTDWLHLIPWLLNTGWWMSLILKPESELIAMMSGRYRFESYQIFVLTALPWLRIASMTAYGITIVLMLRHTTLLKTIRGWSFGMLIWFGGFILAFGSYYILVRFPFFNAEWDYMISLFMILFITGVAIYGYIQPAVFEGYAIGEIKEYVNNQTARYRNSGLTAAAASELEEKLRNLMAAEKLYRNNELRLGTLAEKLGTSKHHLSQIINEKIGLGFFEYINRLRIEEAKELLLAEENQKNSIIEIAYMVGFNNKVSFNTTFKKITGVTPGAFKKQEKK